MSKETFTPSFLDLYTTFIVLQDFSALDSQNKITDNNRRQTIRNPQRYWGLTPNFLQEASGRIRESCKGYEMLCISAGTHTPARCVSTDNLRLARFADAPNYL